MPADMRWSQRNTENALLAYRIAATIAEHNEHYASAYSGALCRTGRVDEGIEWLRARAEKLGNSVHGVGTWITYIDELEDWGNPTKGLEACRTALSRYGASPVLLSFAIPFFARMGEWEEAEEQLSALEGMAAPGYFYEAAVYFNEMRGLTARALEHSESWVREVPLSLRARQRLLSLIATMHGEAEALERAGCWMRERPENEDFEELFCRYCNFPLWRKLRVLKSRVKRNREDGWAWRELAFSAITLFEKSDESVACYLNSIRREPSRMEGVA